MPPARAVFANTAREVCVELTLHLGSSPSAAPAVHVQSWSEWSPAMIGPYSQARRYDDTVLSCGMIALIPMCMALPQTDPQLQHTVLSVPSALHGALPPVELCQLHCEIAWSMKNLMAAVSPLHQAKRSLTLLSGVVLMATECSHQSQYALHALSNQFLLPPLLVGTSCVSGSSLPRGAKVEVWFNFVSSSLLTPYLFTRSLARSAVWTHTS